jgi:hypothetical protein
VRAQGFRFEIRNSRQKNFVFWITRVSQDGVDRVRQMVVGANDKKMTVPGGTTCLLVCQYKGKKREIPVYRVDTAVMAEVRALLRHAEEEELRQRSSSGKRPASSTSWHKSTLEPKDA